MIHLKLVFVDLFLFLFFAFLFGPNWAIISAYYYHHTDKKC